MCEGGSTGVQDERFERRRFEHEYNMGCLLGRFLKRQASLDNGKHFCEKVKLSQVRKHAQTTLHNAAKRDVCLCFARQNTFTPKCSRLHEVSAGHLVSPPSALWHRSPAR